VTDERPKPKYGELAPEGWVWQPPKPAEPDTPNDGAGPTGANPASGAPSAPVRSSVTVPVRPADPDTSTRDAVSERPALPGDLTVTVLLLVVGVLITASWVPFLLDLAGGIQLYLTQQELGTYTAGDIARPVGVTGAVLQVALLAVAVFLSVRRIRARRRAFFIPLIAGAIGFVVTFTCTIIALASDATLMSSLTTMTGG
jgi:hypothetical protein